MTADNTDGQVNRLAVLGSFWQGFWKVDFPAKTAKGTNEAICGRFWPEMAAPFGVDPAAHGLPNFTIVLPFLYRHHVLAFPILDLGVVLLETLSSVMSRA